MATATDRPGSGRDRIRGLQIRDGQPHRYSLLLAGGDAPRLRPLCVISATTHSQNDNAKQDDFLRQAPAPE